MKFNFKIQQYQTDAVDAVVSVFSGQRYQDKTSYIRDIGMGKQRDIDILSFSTNEDGIYDSFEDIGYKNDSVELSDEQILNNIHTIQQQNNIKLSSSLINHLGRCSLDIEVETGT